MSMVTKINVLKLCHCTEMVHVVVKLACYIITNEDPTSTGDSEPWGIRQFASTGFEAVAAGATNAHAAP